MHKVAEMVRASWVIAKSYKLNLVFSIAALFLTTLPFYFAANALQPLMGGVVRDEGATTSGSCCSGSWRCRC